MACNTCKPIKDAATMAVNATKAAGRAAYAVATDEPVLVSNEVFESRLAICRACPEVVVKHQSGRGWHRCSICLCWLDGKYFAKARMATEKCPMDKWRDKTSSNDENTSNNNAKPGL